MREVLRTNLGFGLSMVLGGMLFMFLGGDGYAITAAGVAAFITGIGFARYTRHTQGEE